MSTSSRRCIHVKVECYTYFSYFYVYIEVMYELVAYARKNRIFYYSDFFVYIELAVYVPLFRECIPETLMPFGNSVAFYQSNHFLNRISNSRDYLLKHTSNFTHNSYSISVH